MSWRIHLLLLAVLVFNIQFLYSQCFITGADLSYVNKIVEEGGIYRDDLGNIADPYSLFAEKGANMIRLRLWHTPENIIDYCGNPITSCSLDDVLAAAQMIEANGMSLNLGIHYGDYFNDPGHQLMPAAWQGLSHAHLLDSIYSYTLDVLGKLYQQNTVPEIIGIGNETTWGFVDESAPTDGFTWPDDAEKFNAAFDAVDDFNDLYMLEVKKAIHLTESTAKWAVELFQTNGISNYEVIGISYYPHFSPNTTLEEIGELVYFLKTYYSREIMLFETGFTWTDENDDDYGNFLSNGNLYSYGISPEGQRQYLFDLAQVIYENNGDGLIYWEPAYISSDMCTYWGQGSPYENASFFDFNDNNAALPAFDIFDFCNSFSINEQMDLDEIFIYQDPGLPGRITIETNAPLETWQLFGADGIMKQDGLFTGQKPSYDLYFNNIASGLYILRLSASKGKAVSEKVVF